MAIIDGKLLSEQIKTELAEEVKTLRERDHKIPHLAAVLVGDDPASLVYVRNKVKSCEQIGFKSTLIRKNANISESDLLKIVADLNKDKSIDGFIVQMPLPNHIDQSKVTLSIDPSKDVDGFHPENFGRMAQGLPCYLPATPYGIIQMIERYQITTEGKLCVVVGRSNIVGTPISLLLSRKTYPGNCTVTMTHSRTRDLAGEIRRADIIIAAIGIPQFIKADMVKIGAVVIDVGINRIEDVTRKKGYNLVGDVHYEEVAPKCSYITPVPGGVGPMTVTSLLMNTLKSCRKEIYG